KSHANRAGARAASRVGRDRTARWWFVWLEWPGTGITAVAEAQSGELAALRIEIFDRGRQPAVLGRSRSHPGHFCAEGQGALAGLADGGSRLAIRQETHARRRARD